MITRPLDLASRLAPPPPRTEYVFFINVLLLAALFLAFGARFVLAPGIAGSFLPAAAGAREGAVPATEHVNVRASGQIITTEGLKSPSQLLVWLRERHSHAAAAFATRGVRPVLLISADGALPTRDLAKVISVANEAGYNSTIVAAREPAVAGPVLHAAPQ